MTVTRDVNGWENFNNFKKYYNFNLYLENHNI